jgi:RND family efflux transporter MFP subunit
MRTVFAFGLLLALLAGCGQEEQKAEAIRPVLLQKVVLGAGAGQDVYSGEVRARHEADLGFRIGGKIVARLVDTGATVKKGQPLARLDPQDVQLNADAARAQLAAAQADYGFAKAELERYADLVAKKFVAQTVYDGKLNAHNAAKARLDQAQAQLDVSRNQAAYATLAADQDGVITAVLAEPGQVVTAGQAVVRLAQPREKEVVVNVSENKLAALRAAKTVAVSLWSAPEKIYEARIREISPGVDAATRTFTVKVSLPGADAAVALGMTANLLVQGDAAGRLAVLPMTALTETAGAPAVWVFDPATGKVALRAVKVGEYREGAVTITAGLADGEQVVSAGVHKLVAGQVVRALDTQPVSAAASAK